MNILLVSSILLCIGSAVCSILWFVYDTYETDKGYSFNLLLSLVCLLFSVYWVVLGRVPRVSALEHVKDLLPFFNVVAFIFFICWLVSFGNTLPLYKECVEERDNLCNLELGNTVMSGLQFVVWFFITCCMLIRHSAASNPEDNNCNTHEML